MKTLRVIVVTIAALAIGVLASANAQTVLLTLDRPSPQPHSDFGFSVAVGDVNGDGKGDIAVAAPGDHVGGNESQGQAYVFSGADGSLLFLRSTPNPQPYAWLRADLAVGDVNGDGKADIVVGARFEDVDGNADQGRVYVFAGPYGTPLFALDSPNPQVGAEFGHEVAVGDVDSDGRGDIAVASSEDVGANEHQGRVYVFSGADGSLLFTFDSPNPQPYANFGTEVAVGDVDGDGRGDIVVASSEDVGANEHQVHLFSGADGSLLFTLDKPEPERMGGFGNSLAVADVNGDGKADIVVGADYEIVGGDLGVGAVYVFSGADGSLLFSLDNPNPQLVALFGHCLAVGEVSGDARADIVVGAPLEDVGDNTDQGRVYVFSGADGSLLLVLDGPDPQPDLYFGVDVAVGDVDGDGRGDLTASALGWEREPMWPQGLAYVFSLPTPTPTPPSTPVVGGMVEMQVDGSAPAVDSAAGSSDSSALPYYIALAGAIAAGVVAATAGGWYARRRWLG
ncbi:MAG: hypothetical protein AMJ77_05170 [Dehalococcoidia bacterium SM23_28_2]|nr:MAG: hypothetical protein AMJ77_05170 [Dehalococcoidia bacterium SM23_28_2]